VGAPRNISPLVGGPTQKCGACFSCLLVVAQAQPDRKKLSNHFIDLCDSESLLGSNDAFKQVSEIDNRPVENADFLGREYRPDSVRGRFKAHFSLERTTAH